jgi:hypothetical protein
MSVYDEYKMVLEEIYTLRALECYYTFKLNALWPNLSQEEKDEITTYTEAKRTRLAGIK